MTEAEQISESDVGRDYESSLLELKANSKPHINMLTMLADENQRFASKIAQIIESRIEKVATNQKLPLLYLIDSIVKNCPTSTYKEFFARNLPNIFANIFKNSDEKIRQSLYKLRCTWPSIFPPSKLCALDIKVNEIDPKWPIRNDSLSKTAPNNNNKTSNGNVPLKISNTIKPASSVVVDVASAKDEKQQKELLHRLQQQKLELELQKAQETLRLQQKQLEQTRLQTLKRTTPSPTIVPPTTNGAARPVLLGDSPDSIEIDGSGCWVPMKKVKLEDTIEVGPSVSGFNERTPTPVPATPTPAPVSSEKEKPVSLDSVPVNNRIYVDGRGYEVRFIEDVGVIERNGLPHRISFVGPPKDVVIDGKATSLNFDEVKTITIDGQPHTIKFGAPSRELYLGKNPLRGSFGGPAIFVNVGGTKHKIQLCGPPPEVKIDPEPSYELIRFMHSSHRTQGPVHDFGSQPHQQRFVSSTAPLPLRSLPPAIQTQPQSFNTQQSSFPSLPPAFQTQLLPPAFQTPTTAPPQINVEELLAKLGPIIAPLSKKPPTPPIASSVRFQADEIVEKRRQAPSNLKEFNPSSFKVRYSSLIESLYQKTLQCSTCGLRFVDGDTQKYSRHLDWHFKQNRKDKTFKTNARSWFLAAEDWVNFEELGEDNSTKTRSAVFEKAQMRRNESDNLVTSTDSAILANNDNQNYCSVCGDKFEQFWDEDEEAWKLRNATSLNGKTYHPLCYADVENGEIEPDSNITNVENNSLMWSNIMAGESSSRAFVSSKSVVKAEPFDDYTPVNINTVVKNEPVDDYCL